MILELKYTSNTRYNCTKLNHKIIGQLNHQRHKGKRYIYYREGLLHNIMFCKVNNGHFLLKVDDGVVDIESVIGDLMVLGDVILREVNVNGVPDDAFITGEQYWRQHAEKWSKVVTWKRRN